MKEILEHYSNGKLETLIEVNKEKCGCGDKVIKYTDSGASTEQVMCLTHANALKLVYGIKK